MTEKEVDLDTIIQGPNDLISLRDWIGISKKEAEQLRKMVKPTIRIIGETLPEIWERGVLATWFFGYKIETEYDKDSDPLSRDCTIILVATDPLKEPMIHRAMPGGVGDLAIYVSEVIDGIHDHWIDLYNHQKWQYTYHQRMVAYPAIEQEFINQIDYVIKILAKNPISRRAQIIIWEPDIDCFTNHPPCLQRLWFRIIGNRLVMNAHLRSNDAFKAAFMNMFAFVEVQRRIAELVSERLNREIAVGEYTHIADSFHIYGSYFEEFKGFLNQLIKRSWGQRVYNYSNPAIQEIFNEVRSKVIN